MEFKKGRQCLGLNLKMRGIVWESVGVYSVFTCFQLMKVITFYNNNKEITQSFLLMFAKKKLKREDFLFENGWFEDKLKKPGELQMQQYQISDCEECNIFLFDSAACVYIDECKFCNIFIGACQSSVFIRDCEYLNVICTTQQFRLRDCISCSFAIFCESQPIIESSYDITFSCFPEIAYQQLQSQMKEAKTNPWNNNWFDVYDFTPKKFNRVNHRLSLNQQSWSVLLQKMRQKMKEIGLKECRSIMPRVMGKQQATLDEVSVLVAYPSLNPSINNSIPVIQSREHRLNMQEQIALHLSIPSNEPRVSVLFLKVKKTVLQRWKEALGTVTREISDQKQLQLYQNTVFAPFKDEH